MARRKEVELYTIRNASGQFLAAYRAQSATVAIAAFIRDQNITRSQLRGMVAIAPANVTASVEKPLAPYRA